MTIPVGKGKIEIKIDDKAKKHIETKLNKLAEKAGKRLVQVDAHIEKKTGFSNTLTDLGKKLVQGLDKNASSSSRND